MKIDLSGRTALVTGSTSGIGEAAAQTLASAGADVVINGLADDRVVETAKRLEARGISADVGSAEGVASLIEQLPDVDILVNNVGIFVARPVFEISDEEWLRIYQVNVLSGV